MNTSRYLFIIALFSILVSILYLALWQDSLSEVFAIHVYYSLLGGVLIELIAPLWEKIENYLFGKIWNIRGWDSYVKELKWHMNWIMRAVPVFLIIIILQYLFRDTLPLVFHPTPVWLTLLILTLFLAIPFADDSIWVIQKKFSLSDFLILLASFVILWNYFTDDQWLYVLIVKFCAVILFILSILILLSQWENIKHFAKKMLSL